MIKLISTFAAIFIFSVNTLSFALEVKGKPSESLKKQWFNAYYESMKLGENKKSDSKKLKNIVASMCPEIKRIIEEPYEVNLPEFEQDLCEKVLEKKKLTCSEDVDKLAARAIIKSALIKECYKPTEAITAKDANEMANDAFRAKLTKKCGGKVIIKVRFQSIAKLGPSSIKARYVAADPICEPNGKGWYDFMTDYFEVTNFPNPKRAQCGTFIATFVSKKKKKNANGWDEETSVWRLSNKSEVPLDFWEQNQIMDDCE